MAAIADGAGGFAPRGAAGWQLDDPKLDFEITAGEVATILDPDFEIEGCYLLPREVAGPRAPNHSTYASVRNGHGPLAWNRHWLIVPLVDRGGKRDGLHLGGRSGGFAAALARAARGLRTFANQASAALRAAADLEALTRRNEELAALHRTTLGLLDRLELDSVLEPIVDSARSLLGTTHGYLYLVDDQGETNAAPGPTRDVRATAQQHRQPRPGDRRPGLGNRDLARRRRLRRMGRPRRRRRREPLSPHRRRAGGTPSTA
ncbi:MAG: hypothetical protein ACR2GT_14090 [Gaiellaceae bacterium]